MNQKIVNQKSALRKTILSKRMKLNIAFKKEYDEWICNELHRFIKEKKIKIIHSYLPIRSEINILPLLERLIKEKFTVVSPKTLTKRKLEHNILSDIDKIEDGLYGTIHPSGNEYYEEETYDLIIVPGVAYDRSLFRLGYGGGYYDSFLTDHSLSYKMGICYPFQIVDNVPRESHDAKLDALLYRPIDG